MKLLKYHIKTAAVLITLGLAFMACQSSSSKTNSESTVDYTTKASMYEAADSILVGKHTRKQLEQTPYKEWFETNYKEYEIDKEVVSELEPLLDGVSVKVFMGTWCGDSQYHVPAFFKIMDQAGYKYTDFELYSMTEDKVTPQDFEQGLNITQVPTFIIYKDGKEVNRIVEYPLSSIEKDLLDIMQEKGYKNPYAL